MKAEKFKEIWKATGDSLCQFSKFDLEGARLPHDAYAFLITADLPKEAAPFLDFSTAANDGLLQIRAELSEKYFSIGSNGSGDPIVISNDGGGYFISITTGILYRAISIRVLQRLLKALFDFEA